jgi:protein-tyrosine phosphatase
VVCAVDLSIAYDPSLMVHKLNLRDSEDEEVRYTFFPVIRFIEQERKKGNVLVHCAAGISRSATLLIAYLMNKYQTTYEDCLVLLARKRPCVLPNAGFVQQLKKFQSDLGVKDGANYFN